MGHPMLRERFATARPALGDDAALAQGPTKKSVKPASIYKDIKPFFRLARDGTPLPLRAFSFDIVSLVLFPDRRENDYVVLNGGRAVGRIMRHPAGYHPFCDYRPVTTGLKFWHVFVRVTGMAVTANPFPISEASCEGRTNLHTYVPYSPRQLALTSAGGVFIR